MEVHAVLYSLLSHHRIVLLKEADGERFLPIWIGQHVSEAIAIKLQGASTPRPLTHDLLLNVVNELGGNTRYVIVNELNDGTFYARIAIERDGQVQLIDSRSSDAIALAVRASAPIYADESVMEKAGILPSPEIRSQPPKAEDDLEVFRDFVEHLED